MANKWIGTIRLTKDCEERYTADGKAIARFSGACNRRFKQEGQPDADFFDFVAFGKTAETIIKHTTKGTKLLIFGEVRNNNYEKDGVKHYSTQIVVDSFEFCENKGTASSSAPTPQNDDDANGFIPIGDIPDEELPFA